MFPVDILSQLKNIIYKPFKNKNDKVQDGTLSNSEIYPFQFSLTPNNSISKTEIVYPNTFLLSSSHFSNASDDSSICLSSNLDDLHNQEPPESCTPPHCLNNLYTQSYLNYNLSLPLQTHQHTDNISYNDNYYFVPIYSKVQGEQLFEDLNPPLYYREFEKKNIYHIRVKLPKYHDKNVPIHIQVNDQNRQLKLDGIDKHVKLHIKLPRFVDTKSLCARYKGRTIYIKVTKILDQA